MRYWPMGASKVPNSQKLARLMKDDRYGAQEKFDGIRAICEILGDGTPKFTSRGSTYEDPNTPIDITHRLGHIFGGKRFPSIAGTVFDGEMYDPEQTSQKIAGQLNYRSSVPVSPNIRFYIFDLLAYKGTMITHKPLSYRLEVLSKFIGPMSPYCVEFPPMYFRTPNKEALLQNLLHTGKEGIVLKNMASAYYQRAKKANTWYKVKKFSDIDVVIVGAVPPEKYYTDPDTGRTDYGRITKPFANGWLGSIAFTFTEDGRTYSGATSGLTDDMRELLSDGSHGIKKEFIGRTVEVRYMQRTSDGNLQSPRFVRFRDEIDLEHQ